MLLPLFEHTNFDKADCRGAKLTKAQWQYIKDSGGIVDKNPPEDEV